ncbi:MAG TPA: CusA/CzcA family heavy metal efflux RND transporter [Pseudomonadales bacterium]|nr:CusA/CzcA family heavy metal efflux RND transporter [Pseudomonadales bacterium]
MIEKIIDYSARNRLLVLILVGLALAWSAYSIKKMPLDALPDLSDTQVILFTEWMGRSANLVEDQITYPIVSNFLSAPKVQTVRGLSMFGMSFVYIIFEDGTDIYWARSRVTESLSRVQAQLPAGVTPQMGPDATGVGWIYQYVLRDRNGKMNAQQLRSLQDWHLKYWLSSVPGVAEVASVGGFEKQYQIELNPERLSAFNVSVAEVGNAVRQSNADVGGRVIELAGHEYVVRGRGYISQGSDLENIVLKTTLDGVPIKIKDVGQVTIGANIRRGVADLNGEGDSVGGVVIMRNGENALAVIDKVKTKIASLESALPDGVEIVAVYDRSSLIKDAVRTLFSSLSEEILLVTLTIMVFLFHFRSALVAIVTLPIAILVSFIPMYYMGLTANIMSLAGIVIAVGDVVDAAVVMIENAHKKIELAGEKADRVELVIAAAKELGPSVFSSLIIIVVSFLPVFVLEAQEGKLFSPLAFTKTFSVLFGALLGITLVPALMVWFIKDNIRPEAINPVNRISQALYRPLLKWILKFRKTVISAVIVLSVLTLIPFQQLGSEFMPPLDEGSILFMPVTAPGIAIEQARQLLQQQDRIFKSFPEVQSVFGKAGRAETATDPAPLSMFETIIQLKPRDQWRSGMTLEKLIAEMDAAVKVPGLQNAFTMPIKARIDMLTTGIRTPIGVKVYGPDLQVITQLGEQLEAILKDVPGTRTAYAEREMGAYFLDFKPNRDMLARYGLRVEDALSAIEMAVGGMVIDNTIEGRERYSINIRYLREWRNDVEALKRILIPIPEAGASTNGSSMAGMENTTMPSGSAGQKIPLGMLGRFEFTQGPGMIKNEMGSLTGWVYIDIQGRDIGGYVQDAKKLASQKLTLPPGYYLQWTGQYEFLQRILERLQLVVPLTMALIAVLLYWNFKALPQTLIVMLSIPFAAIGAFWLMWLLDYNTSIAVWVGLIALLGIAAQTSTLMVVYLDEGFAKLPDPLKKMSAEEILEIVLNTATQRVRPVLMAVSLNILGLIPIMMSDEIGSDVAKRIAAPLWGGLVSLTTLTLLIIPAIYALWKIQQQRLK